VDSTDIALVRQHQRDLVHMRPFLVPRAGRTRGRRVTATWKTWG
jgi:hypothetical protein